MYIYGVIAIVVVIIIIVLSMGDAKFICKGKMLPNDKNNEGENLESIIGKTRDECIDVCRNTEGCNAFSYTIADKMCNLKMKFKADNVKKWKTDNNYDFCYQK